MTSCSTEKHHKASAEIQLRLLSYLKYISIEGIKASARFLAKSLNFGSGNQRAEKVVSVKL